MLTLCIFIHTVKMLLIHSLCTYNVYSFMKNIITIISVYLINESNSTEFNLTIL